MNYAIYKPATGEILRVHSSDYGIYVLSPSESFDDASHYILGGVPTPRPEIEAGDITIPADGEKHKIAQFPYGTRIHLDGQNYGMTNGSPTEFVPAEPGEHILRATPPFPYKPVQIKITVTEVES